MHATTIAKTGWNMFLVGTTNRAYYNVNGTWLRSSGISDYVSSFAVNPANKSIVIAPPQAYSQQDLFIFPMIMVNLSNPYTSHSQSRSGDSLVYR